MGVSVIVPFLNPGLFLAEAIDSVIEQTYRDWEIHLVNDGSTDESPRIAREYVDRFPGRIYCHEHPGGVNRGLAPSRNLALSFVESPLVALLDADDVWLPRKLEEQVRLMEAFPSAGLSYGRSVYWYSWKGDGSSIADVVPEPAPEPEWLVRAPLLALVNYPLGLGAAPPPSALMIRRKVFDRVGGFVDEFTRWGGMYEDQAFLIKVYLDSPVVVSASCWEQYRQHDDSICARVAGSGAYEESRRFFLEWYLAHAGRTFGYDARVATAVRDALASPNLQADTLTYPDVADVAGWKQRRCSAIESGLGLVRHVGFGSDLELTTVWARRLTSGGIKLKLEWRAAVAQPEGRAIAVHLIDRSGRILNQADYPQILTPSAGQADHAWCDTLVLSSQQLRGAHAIALGVFDRDGVLPQATGAVGDWDGRRIWLELEAVSESSGEALE